nr:hypothetical protein [Escherichia coli]UGK56695.1 hypothetical protein [Escherichia coli]
MPLLIESSTDRELQYLRRQVTNLKKYKFAGAIGVKECYLFADKYTFFSVMLPT